MPASYVQIEEDTVLLKPTGDVMCQCAQVWRGVTALQSENTDEEAVMVAKSGGWTFEETN